MADFIVVDGDIVAFQPAFTQATVSVPPCRIQASSGREASQPAQLVNGRRCCVKGDEATVRVTATYIAGGFTIPGTGTITIPGDKLLPRVHVAKDTTLDGKKVLLQGQGMPFTAVLDVQVPARMPNAPGPPVPDPCPRYEGRGTFKTANFTRKGQ